MQAMSRINRFGLLPGGPASSVQYPPSNAGSDDEFTPPEGASVNGGGIEAVIPRLAPGEGADQNGFRISSSERSHAGEQPGLGRYCKQTFTARRVRVDAQTIRETSRREGQENLHGGCNDARGRRTGSGA